MNNFFEPKNKEEEILFAAIDLCMDMQAAVQIAMNYRGINQRQLATMIGCTPSNVSQMLSDGGNPRVETIAKALAAMGEKYAFISESRNAKWLNEKCQWVLNEKINPKIEKKAIRWDEINLQPTPKHALTRKRQRANDNWVGKRNFNNDLQYEAATG
tara:strand:+ start:5409 stop:5879 length:471 start_codon:yes stop_codon:yes gene_type:complete